MTAPPLAEPLCFARTAEGEPITSRGRLVVGTATELRENLGNLLVDCTIAHVVDAGLIMVYVTDWAVGR